MLIIELLVGHPVQPSTIADPDIGGMATLMAIFLSASLGASLGLLVYSLIAVQDPDPPQPPPPGGVPQ
jgi:hypothetical protein